MIPIIKLFIAYCFIRREDRRAIFLLYTQIKLREEILSLRLYKENNRTVTLREIVNKVF
jgi:predicted CDP-diglyceride synthetase/phosphatidate cytidylyltransferase